MPQSTAAPRRRAADSAPYPPSLPPGCAAPLPAGGRLQPSAYRVPHTGGHDRAASPEESAKFSGDSGYLEAFLGRLVLYAIPLWTEKAGSMCQIKGVQTAGVVDEQVSMS